MLGRDKMNTGKEAFQKRTPSVCKKCEYRMILRKGHFCNFWGNKLTKIKWCNK
jgi:hypothetical protein